VRARDIKGKTVASVGQEYLPAVNGFRGVWDVLAIRFTDGSCIYLNAVDNGDDLATEVTYEPPRRREVDMTNEAVEAAATPSEVDR
jgi:hypothetical protein